MLAFYNVLLRSRLRPRLKQSLWRLPVGILEWVNSSSQVGSGTSLLWLFREPRTTKNKNVDFGARRMDSVGLFELQCSVLSAMSLRSLFYSPFKLNDPFQAQCAGLNLMCSFKPNELFGAPVSPVEFH